MNMKLPKVGYVAGPFRGPALSQGGVVARDSWAMEQNIRRAEALAHQLWARGTSVICPHCNTRYFQNSLPDHIWLKGDLAQLARCDFVVMTRDWRVSSGARAEWRFALKRGIPIFYEDSMGYLDDWLAGKSHGLRCANRITKHYVDYGKHCQRMRRKWKDR
jgi:hypothetical protein